MFSSVKPSHLAELARHPEASWVEGSSGLQYLRIPENVINPDAQKVPNPLKSGEAEYRSITLIPQHHDGGVFKAPYDE